MSERNLHKILTRRSLIQGASASIAAGVLLTSEPAQAAETASRPPSQIPARSPLEWLPKKVERGGDNSALAGAPAGGQHKLTSFINVEQGIKIAKFKKTQGWSVQIKPTGYRGIPIYTVFDLTMSLDGKPVDPDSIIFVYQNTSYRPTELKDLQGMQWWVFDWATLFVPGEITKGDHEVEVHFKYANTYFKGTATNGAKETLKFNNQVDYLCL
jgi:hypothetical protein